MKLHYIKKTALPLIMSLSMAIMTSSCDKDFGNLNDPWDNKVYSVTIPAMYNNIVSTMTEGSWQVMTSFLYQSTQLAANYAASGYRLDNQVGAIWENYYFALADSRKLSDIIEADSNVARMTNVKAMLKSLMAYKTLQATTLFGDMPYKDAGKSFYGTDNYRPAYDKQADIFTAALEDLKWAVDNFSTAGDQVTLGPSETFLKNDIAAWVKFANSVRLRYAMVMREKNNTAADVIIADALSKPLLTGAETVELGSSNIAALLIDRSGAYRGNAYVRLGTTMWHALSSTDAPDGSGIYDIRTKLFFEPNSSGEWAPFPQNPPTDVLAETSNSGPDDPYSESRSSAYVTGGTYHYSPLNYYYVAEKEIPKLIITGSEVSFLKAEIYNKGIGGVAASPATAQQNYEEGITESVKFWYKLANASPLWTVNKPAAEPTVPELNGMLTNPEVAYSATPATALTQIYKQSWIAFFHQPFDAWTLQRRTGNGTPNVPLAPTSQSLNMNRLVYPLGEVDSNFDNWKAITGGTDNMSVKPWFLP